MANLKVVVPLLNKRKFPVENTTDKSNVVGQVINDFRFESVAEVTNSLGNWYQDRDGYFYWGGGVEFADEKTNLLFSVINNQEQRINWGINLFKIGDLWSKFDGSGIKVAILDSGIERNHPDLISGIMDFNDNSFSDSTNEKDILGHGTHCAGIIGARNNNFGVVGVAPNCELFISKIINDTYGIHPLYLKNGIDWALKNDVHIISMSVGFIQSNKDVRDVLLKAYNKKVILIAAAGNNSAGTILKEVMYPANYSECIAVGAINELSNLDDITVFSERVDLLAPGRNILSTSIKEKDYYKSESGTSMAAAFVAGIVALSVQKIISTGRIIEPQSIKNTLIETADKLEVNRNGKIVNFNIVNPQKFISTI